jgi:hypothetical protein
MVPWPIKPWLDLGIHDYKSRMHYTLTAVKWDVTHAAWSAFVGIWSRKDQELALAKG